MSNLHKEVDEIDGMPESKKIHVKSIMSKLDELLDSLRAENEALKHKMVSMEEAIKVKDAVVVVKHDEAKAYSKVKKKAD